MDLNDELKIYYKKLFPCDTFAKWLTYGSHQLNRREFSFTLAGDIYLRYQCFDSGHDLRRKLVELCPHKIDIGAVYSTAPKKQRAIMQSFKPEWKELVFDIDLTDYDEVRYCCGSQAEDGSTTFVCSRCWTLAKSAVVCVDRALRYDFGFQHILWIYSGRRGVHCWVCDQSARLLDQTARTAIVEYLTLVRGGEGRKISLVAGGYTRKDEQKSDTYIEPQLHPCVDAAAELLLPRFSVYASSETGQDLFGNSTKLTKLLSHLPPQLSEVRNRLTEEWTNADKSDSKTSSHDLSVKRWNTLQSFLSERGRSNVVKELVLHYTYPRLDANVSTGVNHLLKSPFSVHPKTGHVCIPFDARDFDSFDPTEAPTISQLIEELSAMPTTSNSNDQSAAAPPHLLAYKKTSIRSALEYFDAFVQRLLEAEGDGQRGHSIKVEQSHRTPLNEFSSSTNVF